MFFIAVSIIVPLGVVLFLPLILKLLTRKPSVSRWPLVVGAFLYFISWYLPSPDIEGRNTAFVTHFVGGGLYTGFVWLYIQKHLRQRYSFVYSIIGIYFLVSALGVANELFELVVVKAGLVRIDPSDTWWDLVANTSGALLFWLLYSINRLFRK